MGKDDWIAGYRAAVAGLLAKSGDFVRLDAYNTGRSWVRAGDYDDMRTIYGWRDWDGHLRECGIKAWDTESLRERSLTAFQGTFTSNTEEVGMEMKATCNCGKYADKWVRYEGTLGDALSTILGGST